MRARKRFAQHFLESAWVNKLVAAVAATPEDSILEIGPGRGAITRPLAAQSRRLLAVEIDRDLAADLEAAALPNVTVVTNDVLSVDLAPIIAAWLGAPAGPGNQIRIVGNLPYNISSPILFALLDLASRTGGVRDAMLMLQKEVADRLVARVGTGEYGVLTVLTGLHADVTRILSLPPGAFRPPPKVHSAVVRLVFRPPTVAIPDQDLFVRMVRTMFTQRRKTIGNALKPFGAERGADPVRALTAAGIDPRRRPETLDLAEMAALAEAFSRP
jgi:16S rRNA (adenine1518-N6/adenine1519-N6)-dimethyltransferase